MSQASSTARHVTRHAAVSSRKGGAAKTSTVLGLASALAATGKKVAMLDLDSSNRTLSNWFYQEGMMTTAQLLTGKQKLSDATQVRDNLFLVAGHESLERTDNPAVARLWQQLPERVQEGESAFDYIIYDTPGGWNLPTEQAARLALGSDWGVVLIPVACTVESFESAQGTARTLSVFMPNAAQRLRLVLTMRTPAWQNSEDAVIVGDAAHEAGLRFTTAQIPMSTVQPRLTASSFTPFDEAAKAHHLRRAYEALGAEVGRTRIK